MKQKLSRLAQPSPAPAGLLTSQWENCNGQSRHQPQPSPQPNPSPAQPQPPLLERVNIICQVTECE